MQAHSASISSLAEGLNAFTLFGDSSTAVTSIEIDSRRCTAGALFVALRGGYVDGHAFVDEALANGVAAVVAETAFPQASAWLQVADTRAALPIIAANFYQHPSQHLQVVGITGTDGKTTTSYLVDSILRTAGVSTGMVGTVSISLGDDSVAHENRQTTPESHDVQRYLRQMVENGVQTAILEATSHGLALHRLDAVRFAVAAVTNITLEHLELHGTVAEYRAAKGLLFERVAGEHGVAVVNLDDEGARSMLARTDGGSLITYAVEDTAADIGAEILAETLAGTDILLRIDGQRVPAHIPYPGRFNVANALCAAGVAKALHVDSSDIAAGLEAARPVPGRMTRVDRGQDFTVIVDYAHTPESLERILTLLRRLSSGSRLIAVSGSAGERDRVKRPLQGAVSARLADYSVFTSEDPRFEDADEIIVAIAAGAVSAGAVEGADFVRITDRREAITRAFAHARTGDVVLLAGKGHEQSIIWGDQKQPWDEAAVAAELLEQLVGR